MLLTKKPCSTGLIMLWVSLAVLLLDRLSKMWVMQHLNLHEPYTIFPFFDLTLAYNTGAAFSFLDSASGWQNWFLGGMAVVISIIIFRWLAQLTSKDYWMSIALCLVLGGAIGNLLDRILHGHVIDLLSFHWHDWYFAIFNVADSAICVGAFMIFLHWMRRGGNR